MKRLSRLIQVLFVPVLLAAMLLEPVEGKKEKVEYSYDDARLLQAVSEELIAGEAYQATPGFVPVGLMVLNVEELDMSIIEAELNAVKAQRAQLAVDCQAARNQYPNDFCYIKKLNALCAQKSAELKAQEDLLRVFWGDRRKGTTKFFGRINAFRRNVWHKLGAPGRRIVRNVGEAVKEMVLSGHPVTGGAIGVLLRRQVRKEIKNYVFNRIVKKISGVETGDPECDKQLSEYQKTRMPESVRPDETDEAASPTPTEELADFSGHWFGGGACGEGETPAYRWNVELVQDASGWVTGMISFHACPGGGAVFYNVTGQATEDKVLTLTGVLDGGRGDLGGNARSTITFTIRKGKAPKPNLGG